MEIKYSKNNIFAKIIRNEVPANKVYEDDDVLAFYDIKPMADVHILVVPKKDYVSFQDFIKRASQDEISNFFSKIEHIAHMQNLDNLGYRIITNNGFMAGQIIYHFHVHIMSGKMDINII